MKNLLDPYEGQFTQEERKQLIAQTISALRKGKRYSQKEVAAALGVTQATYSTYERGRTEPPAEILVRLAYLFGTSVDILVQKDRLARDTGDVEKQIADLRAHIQECQAQLAENGGDNPVAKAYLQTMKDLLTQMERMSSTQQFADSLAEPLNLAK